MQFGRRKLIAASAGAAVVAAGAGLWEVRRHHSPRALPDGQFRSVTLSWPDPDSDPVLVACREQGLFERYSLDMTIRASSSGQSAISAFASEQLAGAAAPALAWLPAIWHGGEAKVVLGLGPGTYRCLVRTQLRIMKTAHLVGRRLAVVNQEAADRNFFSVFVRRKGINPASIEWIPMQKQDVAAALTAGRIDGVVAHDPDAWMILTENRPLLTDLFGSGTGHYSERVNRVLALRSSFLTDDPEGAVAVVLALRDGCRWVESHAEETTTLLTDRLPHMSRDSIAAMRAHEAAPFHLTGHPLRDQMAQYADELQLIGIFPDTMDSAQFAASACQNILHR